MLKEKRIDVVSIAMFFDRMEELSKIVRDNLSTEIGLQLQENLQTLKDCFNSVECPTVHVDKVKQVLLDPDDMELVNISTGIDAFATDNWCDLGEFERIEEDIKNGDDSKVHLVDFISDEEYAALQDGSIDYIAFRIDD